MSCGLPATYNQLLVYNLQVVKGKVVLCLTKHHTIKTYWESGGTDPRIL